MLGSISVHAGTQVQAHTCTHKPTKLAYWTFVTQVHHLQHISSELIGVQGPLYPHH